MSASKILKRMGSEENNSSLKREIYDSQAKLPITYSGEFHELYAHRRVDSSWDFRGADTHYATHGIYHYPAMMVAPVVKRLIEETANTQGVKRILDPFCGSGSALVEGMLHGMQTTGIDLNPLAVLLARVKTAPIPISDIKENFRAIGQRYVEIPNVPINVALPNWPFWYSRDAALSLSRLKEALRVCTTPQVADFFRMCFGETSRYVSWTRHDEFKVYRMPHEKLIRWHPRVFKVFSDIVAHNTSCMEEFLRMLPLRAPQAQVIEGDARDRRIMGKKSFDMIVTSPPYGDSDTTVAYGQYSRLSLVWLGFDVPTINKIDRISLGGSVSNTSSKVESATLYKQLREIGNKDSNRARQVHAFYLDLAEAFRNTMRHLSPGGTACVVVGNRTVKGVKLETDSILSEVLVNECRLEHMETIVRGIPNKSMPSYNSPSNVRGRTGRTMVNEYILILRKTRS